MWNKLYYSQRLGKNQKKIYNFKKETRRTKRKKEETEELWSNLVYAAQATYLPMR